MTDPEDGADRDGPSDDPVDEDPFVYPSDEDSGDGRDADGDASHDSDAPPESDADGPVDRDAAPDRGAETPAATRADEPRADPSPRAADDDSPSGVGGWLRWFWSADSGAAVYTRDVLTSVGAVLLVGVILFAISGIWPPMVAVESPSMEDNMNTGDLVFVVDNDRFVPGAAVSHDNRTTGVVPADRGAEVGYTEFNGSGDVIIFMPDGEKGRTPVIHRAMLFVEEGENWYDRAVALDSAAVGEDTDSCDDLNNCPAPHAGFVTKGDNNERYDQQTTLSSPVKPEWIVGTAELRVPYLGYVRLAFSGQVAPTADRVAATAANGSPTGVRTPANETDTTPRSPGASRTSAVATTGPGRPVA